jgi:hypothetical protein
MPEFVSWVGEPPPDWGPWTPEELASRVSALHDDALWEAVWVLLDYLTEHHGALVHIEGEGFAQAGRVILATAW